ncbi:hypothetical protein B0H13DRAFT_2365636 [Mycena leptocephala]|nr:hypothetical protein B0H13DRAFT_2365636 [Mycena leptocephala]
MTVYAAVQTRYRRRLIKPRDFVAACPFVFFTFPFESLQFLCTIPAMKHTRVDGIVTGADTPQRPSSRSFAVSHPARIHTALARVDPPAPALCVHLSRLLLPLGGVDDVGAGGDEDLRSRTTKHQRGDEGSEENEERRRLHVVQLHIRTSRGYPPPPTSALCILSRYRTHLLRRAEARHDKIIVSYSTPLFSLGFLLSSESEKSNLHIWRPNRNLPFGSALPGYLGISTPSASALIHFQGVAAILLPSPHALLATAAPLRSLDIPSWIPLLSITLLGLLESQRPFDQPLQAIVLRTQAFIQPFDAYVLFYAIPEYLDQLPLSNSGNLFAIDSTSRMKSRTVLPPWAILSLSALSPIQVSTWYVHVSKISISGLICISSIAFFIRLSSLLCFLAFSDFLLFAFDHIHQEKSFSYITAA